MLSDFRKTLFTVTLCTLVTIGSFARCFVDDKITGKEITGKVYLFYYAGFFMKIHVSYLTDYLIGVSLGVERRVMGLPNARSLTLVISLINISLYLGYHYAGEIGCQ
jgi:hypothetical protein